MLKPLSDSWVILTGASRGIGLATSQLLANAGWNLLLLARDESRLSQLSQQLHKQGKQVLWFRADLTSPQELNQMAEWIKEKRLPIAAVILNAGIARTGKILEMPLNDWRQIFEVNLFGQVALLQSVIQYLIPHGQIIFVNSIAGKTTFPNWGAYAASKFALRAVAQTLRAELSEQKIRVTSIFPSSVATTLHDHLKLNWDKTKMLKPDHVARCIQFVLEAPKEVNFDELVLENMEGLFK